MNNPQVTTVIWVLLGVLLLLLVSKILIVFWRAGWQPKNLRKIKVADVEVERFDEKGKDNSEPQDRQQQPAISVQVSENKFGGDVGDIGGIIVKQSSPEDSNLSHSKYKHKTR